MAFASRGVVSRRHGVVKNSHLPSVFMCTRIVAMNSETWLDKAARLQRTLVRPGLPGFDDDENAARERIKIALWLRREFSEETERDGNVVPFAVGE